MYCLGRTRLGVVADLRGGLREMVQPLVGEAARLSHGDIFYSLAYMPTTASLGAKKRLSFHPCLLHNFL